MKNLFTFLFVLLMAISANAQLSDWSYFEDTTGTLSSPRAIDLNQDGIKDIVCGAGADGKTRVSVIALNGKDGSLLWSHTADDEIFGSPIFKDLNKDGNPDVVIGGRTAELYAFDGKTGKIIWEFFPYSKKLAHDSGWYNFYQPQFLPDLNSDGYPELLAANGGDHSKSYLDTVGRPIGQILIISGKNGKVLSRIKTPDKQETYMSPLVHDFNKDGKLEVIFGSGGETMSGSLWKISLDDLYASKATGAKRLVFTGKKGFVAPPSIGDINGDGFEDLISNAYNGNIYAFSGKTFDLLWKKVFKGFETQSTPALGNFTGSYHPDVLAVIYKGSSPVFKDYIQVLMDGLTGKVVWRDSIGDMQFASPSAFDYNNDGYDEALFSVNNVSSGNYTHDIIIYNFQTKTAGKLISGESGTNLGSTPLIDDLDGNGYIDIVYTVKKNNTNPVATDGLYIKLKYDISTVPAWGIAWGSYLATAFDGKYLFAGRTCAASEFDVNVTKTNPSCNLKADGGFSLTVSPGSSPFVYTWSTGQKSSLIKDLPQGKYNVRVMDSKGCFAINNYTLTDPYEIEVGSDSTFCPGSEDGSAWISSSGCQCSHSGCVYSWSTGDDYNNISGVKPGVYTIVLTHADGCKVYDTVTVYDAPPVLDSFTIKQISCNGLENGSIEIYPRDTFNFKYIWKTLPSYRTDSLQPGKYSVVLRDWRWCYDTVDFEITNPKPLNVKVGSFQNINCFGDSTGSITLKAKGGWKPYEFYYIPNKSYDSVITDLKAGVYTVYGQDSAGCRSDSHKVTLFERPKIIITTGQTPVHDPFDPDGKAWVTVLSGGVAPFTYLWDDILQTTNDTLKNVAANVYTVKVTDKLGCMADSSIEVTTDKPISAKAIDVEGSLMMVYPNPATNFIQILTSVEGEISLLDQAGKYIQRTILSSGNHIMNLALLADGIYYLQLKTTETISTEKIIIIRN